MTVCGWHVTSFLLSNVSHQRIPRSITSAASSKLSRSDFVQLAQVGKGWKSGLMSLEPADIQGERARSPWIGEAWAYRCMVAFGVLFAAAAAFGIAAVGTMMWAYFVSFHITHGPPVWGSVGKASS
jgi:hypothetical protein